MATPKLLVTDVYQDLSLAEGFQYYIDNIGTEDVDVHIAGSPPNDNTPGLLIGQSEFRLYRVLTGEIVYIKTVNKGVKSLVTTTVVDSSGLSLVTQTSARGETGLSIFMLDQTTDVLDIPFLTERSTSTIAVETAIEDRTVEVAPGHGAQVGDILEIAEMATNRFIQTRILEIAVNVLAVDQPINIVYPIGTTAIISSDNMLVDGSSTPVIFSILPLPTQAGDMVRILIDIRGTGAMDFSTFGSESALINGCVLRIKREDGTFKNLFNWKNNGEFINRGLDHDFLVNIGGNQRAFVGRSTFGGQSKRGVVIRLDGGVGEELQIVIQDNLTAGINTEFRLIAQGHEV